MVLLEPPHEDFLASMPKFKKRYILQQVAAMIRTLTAYKKTYRGLFEQLLADWPVPIREPLIDYHLRTLTSTFSERKNLNSTVYDEIRNGGDMPDIPLIVFTATGIDPFTTPLMSTSFLRDTLDAFNQVKISTYTKLASSVPRGEYRVLQHAGHTTIHTDCPDEIIEAIIGLLD